MSVPGIIMGCMYVCMYVCMHVRLYAFTKVIALMQITRMYVGMNEFVW